MANFGPQDLTNYGNPRVTPFTPSEEDIQREVRRFEKFLLSDSEPDEAATRGEREEAARAKKEAAKKKDAARKRIERLRDKAKLKSLYQELVNLRITVNNQNEELVTLRSTVNNQNEELVNLKSTLNKLKEDQATQSHLTDSFGMELVEQCLPNDVAFYPW